MERPDGVETGLDWDAADPKFSSEFKKLVGSLVYYPGIKPDFFPTLFIRRGLAAAEQMLKNRGEGAEAALYTCAWHLRSIAWIPGGDPDPTVKTTVEEWQTVLTEEARYQIGRSEAIDVNSD